MFVSALECKNELSGLYNKYIANAREEDFM